MDAFREPFLASIEYLKLLLTHKTKDYTSFLNSASEAKQKYLTLPKEIKNEYKECMELILSESDRVHILQAKTLSSVPLNNSLIL